MNCLCNIDNNEALKVGINMCMLCMIGSLGYSLLAKTKAYV
jgi:hypothetical protein